MKHANHASDIVGTLNPNCPDCREYVETHYSNSPYGTWINYSFFFSKLDLTRLDDMGFDDLIKEQFVKAFKEVSTLAKEKRQLALAKEAMDNAPSTQL